MIKEIKEILCDERSRSELRQDTERVLSAVHLGDGWTFARFVFDTAELGKYFVIPEDAMPAAPALIGGVRGIDEFIRRLDGTVKELCSNQSVSRAVNKVTGDDGCRLKSLFTDKILGMLDDVAVEKGMAYALCLLSADIIHTEDGYDGFGIIDSVRHGLRSFQRESYDRMESFRRHRSDLLGGFDELRGTRLFNSTLRAWLKELTEDYISSSVEAVTACLLYGCIPILDTIRRILEESAELALKKLELGSRSFRLRPDVPNALLKESYGPSRFTEAHGRSIEMTDDEKIDFVAARVLKQYRAAFEELAK